MHSESSIRIRGSAETVLCYAANVEQWPRLLPHYRSVRVVLNDGASRIVEMKARRGWFPLWWWARQTVLPRARRIRFTHVRGISRGMEAEWRVEPAGDDEVLVTIMHDLDLSWPVLGPAVARWIIGPMFVEPTARATLRHIKRIVEQEGIGRGQFVTQPG